VRFRTTVLVLAALAASSILSGLPASAQAHRQVHPADAAPVAHTFYVSGSIVNAKGHPSLLVGLASISVESSGSYSGTLMTAGAKPATLKVTGTITGTTMTLTTTLSGQDISVQALAVDEPIGDRGSASPVSTAGNEFRGTVMVGSSVAGYVQVIDTSIMREYSFAATVARGPANGAAINGGLHVLADAYGDLRGYLMRDDDSTVYPVNGAIGRGILVVHINMLAGGQIIGSAAASRSVLARLIVYRGSFNGPKQGNQGVWLSSPPES
jgi:hypothetical protein